MPRDPTGSERKDMINKSDLVVVGAGFAGVWAAAAAAALRDDIGVAPGDFPITVVSPGGDLVIRPRLYQSEPWRMYAPLDEVLGALGVSRVVATVTGIDSTTQRITVEADDGGRSWLRYGRLVLASGSQVVAPDLPGADRLFDVDTIAAATRLDAHLRRLHAVSARLTRQLGGTQDRLGRVPVDEFLRVNQTPSIFAAGDTAAARGPDGHAVLQSCQHAIPLGKFAGHNAAADLLGQPLQPFDPGPYITCLDLGTAGAVVATGWDREVRLTGESAKAMKKAIVESYIYPSVDDPAVMLAFARARPNLPLPL
jgi:NADH dehydrogenase FAD-containing subunit